MPDAATPPTSAKYPVELLGDFGHTSWTIGEPEKGDR